MSRISTNIYKRLLNQLKIKSTNAKNQSDKARLLLKEYPKENVKLKEEITSLQSFLEDTKHNNNLNYRAYSRSKETSPPPKACIWRRRRFF